jgi:hypothetical protein
MTDGGMGSVRFLASTGEKRSIGKIIAEAEYFDEDGILVSIVINADQQGNLYEIDFWKVDFSPLCKYPKPKDLKIKPLSIAN